MNKIMVLYLFISSSLLAETKDFTFVDEKYKCSNQVQFNWWMMKIYNLQLWIPEQNKNKDFIFYYKYQKNISAKALVNTTRKEWQRLNIYKNKESEKWLSRLNKIWPDIKKGDSLTAWFKNDETLFYQKNKILGSIEGSAFREDFSQIWLHPKSKVAQKWRNK